MVSLNAAEEFYITWILDDIKLYLDKFSNILNNIAILDRSFLDMKFLKPIFCATALIGLHVTGPYFALLLLKKTPKNYDVLYEAFQNQNELSLDLGLKG